MDHDFAEQAVELENGEVLSEIGREAEGEINMINRALIRMDEGVYGECMDCGDAIAEARLLVQPYSSLCIRSEIEPASAAVCRPEDRPSREALNTTGSTVVDVRSAERRRLRRPPLCGANGPNLGGGNAIGFTSL